MEQTTATDEKRSDEPIRAVPPREFTRGYWTDDNYDDRFVADPPEAGE